MEIKIIKKNQGMTRKISETYQVTNFLTKDLSENISVAVSTAKNHSETTKNLSSDRVYFILDGKLTINEDITAESGDMVFIPKNTEYSFKGTFKAVLINSPAFNPKDEQITKLQ